MTKSEGEGDFKNKKQIAVGQYESEVTFTFCVNETVKVPSHLASVMSLRKCECEKDIAKT